MIYKIVERDDHSAVHSVGYYDIAQPQARIDSGDVKIFWSNKEAEFIVIPDED